MLLDTTTRFSRRGLLTLLAAVAVLSAMLAMVAPASAHAAAPQNAGVTAAGWTPHLALAGFKEREHKNVDGLTRDRMLENCAGGYLCVAVGQGDGLHTVYELWYCTERSLSNFIDAGEIHNNQTGNATARLLDGSHNQRDQVNAQQQKDVDWAPIWYLKPC
jgi:phage/plasmid primase-like uncharacterized protein